MGSNNIGQKEFSIVSPSLTVEALRDSGYKDTDRALAELIDNSVDAKATQIDVIAVEEDSEQLIGRKRAQVNMVAVADNGLGMDGETLRRSLRFGDGTRLDRAKKSIGRFGVGLPQASVSQCTRVDVWSWTNGPDNAFRCYLDLDEIKNGEEEIREAVSDKVPDKWREISDIIESKSGTLVIWTNLDRIKWSGGDTMLKHTEMLCGRIYRNFLIDDKQPITINLIRTMTNGNGLEMKGAKRPCLVNDPQYLITPSSTPEPFANDAMFRHVNEQTFPVRLKDGTTGDVTVKCSMAREGTLREGTPDVVWPKHYQNAGDAPWGKHANHNKGVSILRAGRELELSTAWVNNYDPTERWWAVEVAFEPILDEIFGVDNSKQHAHSFTRGAAYKWKDHAEPGDTLNTFKSDLVELNDSAGYLHDIWSWIDDQIGAMRKAYKQIQSGTRTPRRHPSSESDLTDLATRVIEDQKARGIEGDTDKVEKISSEKAIEAIKKSAISKRVSEETALEWAVETIMGKRRVLLQAVNLNHEYAFFEVETVNDVIEIWVNLNHPVHKQLIDVLSDVPNNETIEELRARLSQASFTLLMLLVAWARYEDKAPPDLKKELNKMRMDWGLEVCEFIDALEP